MSRGNQREIDRQRAQKKQEEKLKAAGRVSESIHCLPVGLFDPLVAKGITLERDSSNLIF